MFHSSLREKLKHSTLVLASPCNGNLGAMTLDCLLATLSLTGNLVRSGSGLSKYLLPMTGYECFPGSTAPFMIMPVEVYAVSGVDNLYFIQIRSDCHPKDSGKFLAELTQELEDICAGHLILLSGFGEDDVVDEHQPFSIGGFYTGNTAGGADAIDKGTFSGLADMLAAGIIIDLPSIGAAGEDSDKVEVDESNIALGMLRAGVLNAAQCSLPITVMGSCCRLNDRFEVSKQNAFRIGASLGVLPSELKSMEAPLSWKTAFVDDFLC